MFLSKEDGTMLKREFPNETLFVSKENTRSEKEQTLRNEDSSNTTSIR